ncbi:hypothetical protein HK414_03065 [Ramlibacter terrae]|uniref:Calx-beta domain-containing protein n=1 Tax=Ramlibacter terrae TaxID=2732511 RepID=A0ABX6P0A6_9BURK|nr:hypothetical protein HK414_03065 [Ramlibacter terrae]
MATAASTNGSTAGFSVRVATIQDNLSEADEGFRLTLARTAGNALSATTNAQATIVDDDGGKPRIAIDDVAVDESAGTAVFTVRLTQASNQTVTVDWATRQSADAPATAGTDYTAGSGTLTFLPGETVKTITIAIAADADTTAIEKFEVLLTEASNAVIEDGIGIGTIADDDTGGTTAVVISNPLLTEGQDAVFSAVFTRTLTAATAFQLKLTPGSAAAGSDYAGQIEYSLDGGSTWTVYTAGSNITAATGSNGFLVRAHSMNDTAVELAETFSLGVTRVSGNQFSAVTGGVATIMGDDNRAALVSVGDVNVDESAGTAAFTLTLSRPSSDPVTVTWSTAAGSATAGTDYTTSGGTVTFAPGTISQTISVPILNDGDNTALETFFVNLTSATGALLGDRQGVATSSTTTPTTPPA